MLLLKSEKGKQLERREHLSWCGNGTLGLHRSLGSKKSSPGHLRQVLADQQSHRHNVLPTGLQLSNSVTIADELTELTSSPGQKSGNIRYFLQLNARFHYFFPVCF